MQDKKRKSIYKCPVCNKQLVEMEKQYICDNRHCFDISQKNYVNLLLANQKKTKDPGDNKEMMDNRRSFLNKGYYSKFSDWVNEFIEEQFSTGIDYILDSGCGEGYFISRLKDKINSENTTYYGIDISKTAIKYASKRDKNINFAVASSFNLPILDNSVDCIIRNFSPGENKEFRRILKDDGKFIVLTPGVDHLFELKQRLYEKPRKHEIKKELVEGFKLIEHREIRYSIDLLDNQDIQNIITMTPYYWSITNEMKSNIDKLKAFTVVLHFNMHVYMKD